MWSNAQSVAQERASGPRAEQPGSHRERRELSLARRARMLHGPSWKTRRERERDGERTERESGGRVIMLSMVLAYKCTALKKRNCAQ